MIKRSVPLLELTPELTNHAVALTTSSMGVVVASSAATAVSFTGAEVEVKLDTNSCIEWKKPPAKNARKLFDPLQQHNNAQAQCCTDITIFTIVAASR
eukprot:2136336-Amphidinium_carterae.1